ncbi:putative dihydroorotase [Lachnellula subtilissima]|uniref:Putative dihydroorotase n=1 Tax=Lachnellula subtilissima TaxID=602034 RepID=A0A8H8RLL9_9HELO|nr:putative dihydroorotase [Lachnellula subtilissima]
MPLSAKFNGLELPASADFHVHLRDGAMMKAVVPTIRAGGCNTVYDPSINYLMTLYLHESISAAVVKGARAQGIVGIKSYPAGVTTNSSSGVLSYEPFYPVFTTMENRGMVLNLHGECPSGKDITILNADSNFLPTLKSLHAKFPKLKIVLGRKRERRESTALLRMLLRPAHHLYLIVDDWADNPFSYCKPVAKNPSDREALIKAALDGTGKFFMGSDSAPHDISAKKGGTGKTAAGVFTQPYVTQLVLGAFEEAIKREVVTEADVTAEILEGFLGGYGRKFYGITDSSNEKIVLVKGGEEVQESFKGDGVEFIPFRKGQSTWSIQWK